MRREEVPTETRHAGEPARSGGAQAAGEPRLPIGIDPNRPSAARIYDCFLGGTHNFAADRAVAARSIELVPEIPLIAKSNRAFLHRATRMAAAAGVRQFIDIGSGIPTEGNVHEIAREVHPDARVVYVDVDPTAVLHARAILGDDPQAVVVQADLHQAQAILDDPAVRRLLDFSEPICLLMIAVLHFMPDTPKLRLALDRYLATVPPGSYLAISHASASARPESLGRLADLYTRTGNPLVLRDQDQLVSLLDGWTILEPGIVYTPQWRPDPDAEPVADPASYIVLAGVGRR